MGLNEGVKAIGDGAVSVCGLVLVGQCGPFVVVAVHAMRLASEAPVQAAKVLPVWRGREGGGLGHPWR